MKNNLINQSISNISFAKPMMIGGGIALMLMILFVSGVDNPDPAWGKFWIVRPLVVITIAGAMGGAFFAFLNHMADRGMNRTVAVLLGLMVYVVGIWLGSVLGLDGTLWH